MRLPAAMLLLAAAAPAAHARAEPVATARSGSLSAVLSRAPRGAGNFQYFLDVRAGKRLVLAAPPNRLIPRLVQGHGTARYFPMQRVALAGIARLDGADFALVEELNTGADCGMGRVALIGRHGTALILDNPCGLAARIERGRVILTGPYYAKDAPLYKPTIPQARAVLTRQDGRFVETPCRFPFTQSSR
ncbi:MAG: hypothetical protein ACYCZB_07675 [Acidiphilium sp.]